LLNSIVGFLGNGAGGAAGSFESIATLTASGGETVLSFTSIPSTYVSLQIRGIYRDTQASALARNLLMQFNSDTGSNYVYHRLEGTGTAATASGAITQTQCLISDAGVGDSATANIYGSSIIDIHDYASTTRNKTMRAFAGVDTNGGGQIGLSSSLWISTAAISSIQMKPGNTAFKAGTTFALYGIKGA